MRKKIKINPTTDPLPPPPPPQNTIYVYAISTFIGIVGGFVLFLLPGKLILWGGGDGKTVHLLWRSLPEAVGKSYVCLTRGSEPQRGGEDVVSADICTPAVCRVKKKKKCGSKIDTARQSTPLESDLEGAVGHVTCRQGNADFLLEQISVCA